MVYDPSKYLLGPIDLTGAKMKLAAIQEAGRGIQQSMQHRDKMELQREELEAKREYNEGLLEHYNNQLEQQKLKSEQEKRKLQSQAYMQAADAFASGDVQKGNLFLKSHNIDAEYIPAQAPRPIAPAPGMLPYRGDATPQEDQAVFDDMRPPPAQPAEPAPTAQPVGPPPSASGQAPAQPRTSQGMLPAAALAAAQAVSPAPAQAPVPPPQPPPGVVARPPAPGPEAGFGMAMTDPTPARLVAPDLGMDTNLTLYKKERADRIFKEYAPVVAGLPEENSRKAAFAALRNAMETGNPGALRGLGIKTLEEMSGREYKRVAAAEKAKQAQENFIRKQLRLELKDRNTQSVAGTNAVVKYLRDTKRMDVVTSSAFLRNAREMIASGNPAAVLNGIVAIRNSQESGVMTEPDRKNAMALLGPIEAVLQEFGYSVDALRNIFQDPDHPETEDAMRVFNKLQMERVVEGIDITMSASQKRRDAAEAELRGIAESYEGEMREGALNAIDRLFGSQRLTDEEAERGQAAYDKNRAKISGFSALKKEWDEKAKSAVRMPRDQVEAIIREESKAQGIPFEVVMNFLTTKTGSKNSTENSSLDSTAVSDTGEGVGVMQLHPKFNKERGVTDPFDVRQNVRAGVRYLKKGYDRYDQDVHKMADFYRLGGKGMADKEAAAASPEALGIDPEAAKKPRVKRALDAFDAYDAEEKDEDGEDEDEDAEE
jgi:hypothetical protein